MSTNNNDTENILINIQEQLYHVKGEAEALKDVLQDLHQQFFELTTELTSLKSVIRELNDELKEYRK